MDIMELLNFNIQDIFGQIISGVAVLLVAGLFSFFKKIFSRDSKRTKEDKSLPEIMKLLAETIRPSQASSLDVTASEGESKKTPTKTLPWRKLLGFLSFYLLTCLVISVVVFVLGSSFFYEYIYLNVSLILESFVMLALPAFLVAFIVAVIIYTSNVKEFAIIAGIVIAVIIIIEISRGGDLDALTGMLFSISHIIFAITIGPAIGILIKKIRDGMAARATGIVFGGYLSVSIYSLLMLVRMYLLQDM